MGSAVSPVVCLAVGTANLRSQHRRTALRCADWVQALRHISKQAKTAHFKHEVYGATSSTMTAGDWLQLCNECGQNI